MGKEEFIITVVPLLLGEGIPLFQGSYPEGTLELLEAKSYPNEVVKLRYKFIGEPGYQG